MITGAQISARALTFQTKINPIYQYKWNGKGPTQFDCSGFVKYVLEQLGITGFPHGADAQELYLREHGKAIALPRGLVTAGIVLFVDDHNGFAVGDGNSMEARNPEHDLSAYDATINFSSRTDARAYMIPGVLYRVVDYLSVKRGSKNPVVGWVQQALNAQGSRLQVDDDFGAKTEDAVRLFQSRRGLVVDGIAGPITQKALNVWETL